MFARAGKLLDELKVSAEDRIQLEADVCWT